MKLPLRAPPLTRRQFVQTSLAVGAVAATPFDALAAHRRPRPRVSLDYGPHVPTLDEATGLPLLELPEGFRYVTGAWTGDPMRGADVTPNNHDGMGCFFGRGRTRILIRNHERGGGGVFSTNAPVYDPMARGGTTHLVFDPTSETFRGSWASLTGTLRNCAGGMTPWKSWISCEETTDGPGNGPVLREHGFCFEVPVRGDAEAVPLRAMGRFSHEAVAFAPNGAAAYLTEDANAAGLYRFVPNRRQRLDSGRLQMLRIRDAPNFDTRSNFPLGESLAIDWVDIEVPDPTGDRAAVAANSVYSQGSARGGARFIRLEGIWRSRGRFYFSSTSGGAALGGQIFEIDPRRQTLRLVFESPGQTVLDRPDNIAANRRGGIVLCEDGGGRDRILGLTREGDIFPFARGNVVLQGERGFFGDFTSSELAGVCWSPRANWMFVNIQRPGITCAITGPWRKGAL